MRDTGNALPRANSCWWWALLVGLLAGPVGAAVLSVPEYHVGQTARVDIVCPMELVVIDPRATADLRLKESQRVPPIYRFDSNIVEQVIAEFSAAFATNRQIFLGALERSYKTSQISARDISLPRFGKFLATFQKNHPRIPIATNLAQCWARGGSDQEILGSYEETLRFAMSHVIRPDPQAAGEKGGFQRVRLIPPELAVDAADPAMESWGVLVNRTNIMGIGRARTDLVKNFPPEERNVAVGLAGFLLPNCFFAEELTRAVREQRTKAIFSATRYAPGQTIARSGDVIDDKILAALDRLRTELLASRQAERAARSHWSAIKVPWLVAGGGGLGLLAWVVYLRRRRSRAVSLVPVLARGVSKPGIGTEVALTHRERSALTGQLAEWLSQAFIRRLFWQRQHLLESQRATAEQAQEIEQRLALVQQQTQERFRAYEQRIRDLERELVAAEEDKRDLIRARLQLAREEWESQRATNPLGRN